MPGSGGQDINSLQVRWLKVCGSVPKRCPSVGMSSDGMEKGSARPGSLHHLEAAGELRPESGRKDSQASS